MMYKKVKPFFMVCETPLHAGSGNDLGIVDLPIQRERHTKYPKIEASSLKGSIRQVFEQQVECKDDKGFFWASNVKDKLNKVFELQENKKWNLSAVSLAFGPDAGDLHAGALGFTDARILLFPVKSMKGVFGWITCRNVLERFKNDFELAGVNVPELPKEGTIPKDSNVKIKDNQVVLEEYTIKLSESDTCTKFAKWLAEKIFPQENPDNYQYWRKKMEKDLLVLENDDFDDFVTLSTEFVTRTKINSKTGTVEPGALFVEEYLPSDSILYSLVLASPIFNQEKSIFGNRDRTEEELVMAFFEMGVPEVVQIGGNATLGKGITRIRGLREENQNAK